MVRFVAPPRWFAARLRLLPELPSEHTALPLSALRWVEVAVSMTSERRVSRICSRRRRLGS